MQRALIIFTSLALTGLVACSDTDGSTNDDQNTVGDNTTEPMPLGWENRPALGVQIDRAGRPAISTALIETFNGDDETKGYNKDLYNAAEPVDWSDFADSMASSLAILDSLDTVCGNQLLANDDDDAGRYATLASILADDQLYVHSARGTCGTYLGLEAEVVGALDEGAGGCGGRLPAEDVIDRSYSVLAAGILTGVDDTIAMDDGDHSGGFPFLAAPSL